MDMGSETTREYLEKLLKQAIKTLGFTPASFNIIVPEPDFGDYATNAALILGKNLKKNPAEIAGSIAQAAEALNKEQVFREISAVGGFVNFKLSDEYLAKQALRLAEFISFIPAGKGKKVIFEYSSPNTNKPLHIGHTRNDVYGAACINLLKAIGYNVVTCEIINDRGSHIMKSVLMYMKHGEGKTPSAEKMKPDHFVGKFYQMFAAKAAESQEAEKQLLEEAQNLLQKWEAGDAGIRKIWRQMNDWFFEGVKQTYEKEGSRFDEVNYESEIYDKGRDLVLQGVSKGIFVKEADGSVSVDFTDQGLDKKTLLRKDGTTLYITQDMYLWDLRNRRHSPDLAIVTTSAEQVYHFRILKKIFELFKYPWAENFKHLPYEHVFLGKNKMSSREGNAISADELLDSVKKQVREVMRGSERVKAKVDDEKLVQEIAFGAIKYGYLKYEPNTRIYFD
ncbi:MAG: arginine--tRNA ligase, partial [Candidatus Doudnabacteria bacterium]|nr:arginine--tRNA ligase [Candidatus Doudnabacteria bacterium]